MELITSEYSWEQALYKIIAWEGLDPWDLDIKVLSETFVSYMAKIEKMDFKIPAKYVIIAAVLLRMKSDHLDFLEAMLALPEEENGAESEMTTVQSDEGLTEEFELNPISAPNKRQPMRRVVLLDLILALRKVMRAQDKRERKKTFRTQQIRFKEHNISKKIDILYSKINEVLKRIKDDKVTFSQVVTEWNRKDVVDCFIPMVYLDHQKKIECTQKEPFQEIVIRRR